MSKYRTLRFLTAICAVASSAVMLACGGDPAPGPAPTTDTSVNAALAVLEITVAQPTLQAKADQSTSITVTAVDANRRALPDIPVSLSASSGIISSTSDKTDAQGRMTGTFGLGSDRGNRDVTVTAKSGAVVGAAGITVSGATLALTASPPTAIDPTTPVEISASVVDAGKVPLGGVVVSFVTNGGTLSSAVATTNAAGIAKVNLTGVTANVTVLATGANAAGQADVTAGSAAAPAPEPAGVVIKDLTVQANPSVIGPNSRQVRSQFLADRRARHR